MEDKRQKLVVCAPGDSKNLNPPFSLKEGPTHHSLLSNLKINYLYTSKSSRMQLSPIPLEPDTSNPLYQTENCQALISIYDEYYPKAGYQPPWTGYFIIRDNTVVGSCGFTKAPENGRTEIALWTFPEYEGQGIAGFACGELIRIAHEADPTVVLTAKTAPEENASVHLLQKNGFNRHGTVEDEEIGEAWLWEKS